MNDSELVALAAVVQADLLHAQVMNQARAIAGEAPAYVEVYSWEAYQALEAELRRRGVLPRVVG